MFHSTLSKNAKNVCSCILFRLCYCMIKQFVTVKGNTSYCITIYYGKIIPYPLYHTVNGNVCHFSPISWHYYYY